MCSDVQQDFVDEILDNYVEDARYDVVGYQ